MRTFNFITPFALGAALGIGGIGLAQADNGPATAPAQAPGRVVTQATPANGPTAGERGDCRDHASKHADRRAHVAAVTPGDARPRTLTSESMGWYLDDIYRRMDKAGL